MMMRIAMKSVLAALILFTLVGSSLTQDVAREPATTSMRDLLAVAASDSSLSMFVNLLRMSGLAKLLHDENPITVFALSNQALANLQKEDRKVLFTDPAALHFFLEHYIVRGNILDTNAAKIKISNATTLQGIKLRTESKSEGFYVNGARLTHPAVRCANGTIYILDAFDPLLVHKAVTLASDKR
jgi:uncharacterized surface protein with fasciclin (FAS1) repeats